MAETTRFLAATEYTHIQWMDRDKLTMTTGVRLGIDSELAPTCGGADMNVAIAAGEAFLDGRWYDNSAPKNIAQTADADQDRINRVVLRWDVADGIVDLQLLAGTPDTPPVAPALTWDGTTKELSLCQVYIAAAAATIDQSNVTDERFSMSAAGPGVIEAAYNDSGATRALGATVVHDTSGTKYFNVTTTANDLTVLGIVAEDDGIASTATGKLIRHGVALVMVDGNAAVGQYIRTSTTAGQATPTSNPEKGVYGKVLQARTGAGLCWCDVFPPLLATATPTANSIVAYNASGKIPDNSVPAAAIDGTIPAGDISAKVPKTFPFHFSGVVAAGASTYEYVVPWDFTVTGGYISAVTAPAGCDMVFDIHSGEGAGTTIWTTQGNRPTLAEDSDGPTAITVSDVTSLVAGTRIKCICDVPDDETTGADVTVELTGTTPLI